MTRSTPSLTYLRFLHLADAVRRIPSAPWLDDVEERMLAALAAAWRSGQPMPVTEAVRTVPEVSERTAFRRLKSLQAKGMLDFVDDSRDGRVRHLKPTALADAHFERLGRCMEQVLASRP